MTMIVLSYTQLMVAARRAESEVIDTRSKTQVVAKMAVVTATEGNNELEGLKQQIVTLKSLITKDPKRGE